MFSPQHLKAWRIQANLTQADLADRLGVDRTTITRAERGERRIDLDLLQAWCRACGMNLSATPQERVDELLLLAIDVIPRLADAERVVLRTLLEHWNVRNL